MMDLTYVSPKIILLTKGERKITFKSCRLNGEKKPIPDECKDNLIGVHIAYAFYGKQDWGIKPMAEQFGAINKYGLITKIPKTFKIIEFDGVRAIKFGANVELDSGMVRKTKEAGLIGYWDDADLIICASEEYDFLIDSIWNMFRPKHVMFSFNRSFAGCNLLILSIF